MHKIGVRYTPAQAGIHTSSSRGGGGGGQLAVYATVCSYSGYFILTSYYRLLY